MIKTLHNWGVRSNLAYTAGIASIGLAFGSWLASNRLEGAGMERADRWGIFVGEWAPTFFALGVALRMEEMQDEALPELQERGAAEAKAPGRAAAASGASR